MFLDLEYATPLTITSNNRELTTETLSLKTQVNSGTAQRFEMRITLEPDNGDNKSGARILAHRASHGRSVAFSIPMPQWPTTTEDLDDVLDTFVLRTPTTVDHEAGVRVLSVGSNDIGASSTDDVFIPTGRFIRFANHSKIYTLTEDYDLEAPHVNPINMNIYPALIDDVPRGTEVLTAPNVTVYYNGGESISLERGVLTRYVLSVVEAV